MELNKKNIYELLENDLGEIMLLIYADEQAPENPTFRLNKEEKYLELIRKEKQIVIINGLKPETIEKLAKLDKLYVSEMKDQTTPESQNGILYAYTATLQVSPTQENTPTQETTTPPKEELSLADKAKSAREKLLKKS